jgi:hypothetical protein
MAQVWARAAATAGYLVRPLPSPYCHSAALKQLFFFFSFFFGLLFYRSECDPDGTGSLDRDAFVRGMSRIDEELRRAQVLGRARAGSSASPRAPPPVPSRPILR